MVRAVLISVAVLCAACASADPGAIRPARRERLVLIRDTAAEVGIHNAALIGGIAISETQAVHCWSDATYACQGPMSPSCGGPVIAGSADGPCSAMHGGLGMFQFDAGTWTETIATYGEAILTIEGNTAQAVAFVIAKIRQDVPEATSDAQAIAWINQVPMVAGDPAMETWAGVMACRYNGCCAATARCDARAAGYRDHALALVDELGAAFWQGAGMSESDGKLGE